MGKFMRLDTLRTAGGHNYNALSAQCSVTVPGPTEHSWCSCHLHIASCIPAAAMGREGLTSSVPGVSSRDT